MQPNQNTENFQQEIALLEQKLATKKQEMLQSGIETPEKHIFKEVVREHGFAGEMPKTQIPAAAPAANVPARTATAEEQASLNTLIAHAFTKGIAEAVSEARKIGNPFLIDTLHDRLVDEYYEKLVMAKKIKAG